MLLIVLLMALSEFGLFLLFLTDFCIVTLPRLVVDMALFRSD